MSRHKVHADAFVPERSREYTALRSANPYNILCVGVEKSSVDKIATKYL